VNAVASFVFILGDSTLHTEEIHSSHMLFYFKQTELNQIPEFRSVYVYTSVRISIFTLDTIGMSSRHIMINPLLFWSVKYFMSFRSLYLYTSTVPMHNPPHI
jgi:hypothetical protein